MVDNKCTKQNLFAISWGVGLFVENTGVNPNVKWRSGFTLIRQVLTSKRRNKRNVLLNPVITNLKN